MINSHWIISVQTLKRNSTAWKIKKWQSTNKICHFTRKSFGFYSFSRSNANDLL